MKIYRLQKELYIPVPLEEAWAFFSVPENLNRITPPDMNFEILTGRSKEAYAGQIITYRIRPLMNIPMNWVTEITHLKNMNYFVDEQRFGPYKFWHHLHRFEAQDNGTLMEDILHYALPFGIIGNIANTLMVEKRVNEIFTFREKALKEIFA